MATLITSEFVKTREPLAAFSMLEQKGIVARLVEELALAIKDFTRDPRSFLRDLFADEAKDLQRRKRLRMGLALALTTQLVLFGVIAYFGWHHSMATTKADELPYKVKWVDPNDFKPEPTKTTESAANGNDSSKVEMPKGNRDAGASNGGGGNESSTPAKQGVLPPAVSIPPMVSVNAPSAPAPSLAISPTIEGIPTPPPPNTNIGLPNGDPHSASGGKGTGDGLGDGNGPGAGNNTGPGAGNGKGERGSGTGTGNPGTPNGSLIPTGPINYSLLAGIPDSTGIVFVRRVKPIVTAEAQANKDFGYVFIEATFNKDGTISDIVIRQSVPSMDEQAKEAVRQIKFRPATIRGEPITLRKVPIKVPIRIE
ncbi:MAG: TonB family protein [Acidobacteria bacterium]|nr:TonB family protein [Acidobacteriota bacterium]